MTAKTKKSDQIKIKLELLKVINSLADKNLHFFTYYDDNKEEVKRIEDSMAEINNNLTVFIKEVVKKIGPEYVENATNAQKTKLLQCLKVLHNNFGIKVKEIELYEKY